MKLWIRPHWLDNQPSITPILETVQFETVEVESPFERSLDITLKHVEIPIPHVAMHLDLVIVESGTNKPAHNLCNYPPLSMFYQKTLS